MDGAATSLRVWSTRRALAVAYAALLLGVGLIVLRGSPIGSTFGLFSAEAASPPVTVTADWGQPLGSPEGDTLGVATPLVSTLTTPGATTDPTAPTPSPAATTPEPDATATPEATPTVAPTPATTATPTATATPTPEVTPAPTDTPSADPSDSQDGGD